MRNRRDQPHLGVRIILGATRVWLPAVIAVAGVVGIIIGHGKTAAAGAGLDSCRGHHRVDDQLAVPDERQTQTATASARRRPASTSTGTGPRWAEDAVDCRSSHDHGRGQRHARLVLGRRSLPRCRGRDRARARARSRQGAAILDIGGESTRPGAAAVPEDEELRAGRARDRGAERRGTPGRISIDTSKARVAARALRAGATLVNDVTALRGDRDRRLVADADAELCLMHMLGDPAHDAGRSALRRRGR